MPTATITMDRYADDLHDLFTAHFKLILKIAAKSDADWKHRISTFNSSSLLEFVVPSTIKPKPIEFDESKLDDPKYRRMLVRKLQAPRPSKWARHKLPIDRAQVSDDTYCEKIAKVLAYKWIQLLMPFENHTELVTISRATVEDLEYMLDNRRLNCISAKNFSGTLIRRLAESLVEQSPEFKALEAKIRAAGEEARAILTPKLKEISRDAMASASESLGKITDETHRKLDEVMDGIRERLQESARRSQKALDEHGIDPNEDRDETFRRAVKRREAERKFKAKARWRKKPFWIRILPTLSVVAIASVLFFGMEVAGVTPYEWLNLQLSN